MYAEIALNVPVRRTFNYHIPPDLDGLIEPGQLVQIAFGTAQQHGIVLHLLEKSDVQATKPVSALLDARPVLNDEQLALAYWMSEYYRMPIGLCLWLFLPPGITGKRDLQVELLTEDIEKPDPLEKELIALLKRRGTLTGQQLNIALPGQDWREAVDRLAKAGIIHKENKLMPPRAKPKLICTAALAINPNQIMHVARHLGRSSKQADLLEVIAAMPDDMPTVEQVLSIAETSRATLNQLAKSGLVILHERDNRDDPQTLSLTIPLEAVDENLITLRKGEKFLHILQVLARENEPIDVSWLYAQTDAKLADLKRLEDEGLVILSEEESWRDSLAQRDFVPSVAPALTPEQQVAWQPVEARLKAWDWGHMLQVDPHPTSPASRGGENNAESPVPSPLTGRAREGSGKKDKETWSYWRTPPHLWRKLSPLVKEMRQAPTPAEERLWQQLRREQTGYKFRRQHAIDRFIVDFYCAEKNVIIEVDGDIHQYTAEEDAIRQEFLEFLGLVMLRFTNEQVFDHIEAVLAQIAESLASIDPHPTSPASRGGENNAESPVPSPLTEEGQSNVFLLHGVTGSGKTEIYLRAIELTLAQGRQAMFLVPEIALTAQTIRRVASRFPGRLAVVHGALSEGERYDTWRRAREGLIDIVVGPRSALFTPLPDIGLIILDEEHDQSYKQGPGFSQPYYHSRQVAEIMMRRNDGLLILGSATPDLESAFRARRGDMQLLEMPNRIMGHRSRILELSEREGVVARYYPASAEDALMIDLPPVEIVDMRAELKQGNTSMFSHALHVSLGQTLQRDEQAMLFLNRRGMNTFVFCRDCGYIDECPRCDVPLTYHQYDETMRCHLCGYVAKPRQVCPACQSRRIKYFGAGTQHIEKELRALFPHARILRWDADTARSPRAHDEMLQQFVNRQADVLIGTQMVAKGLDLPLVTLVGVVNADVGLGLPDFRAGERNFQLLTQVSGRAGRGLLGGKAILQTYQPDHYVIQAAAQHDYNGFYEQEIAYRREMGYPPFRRLVRVVFQMPNESKARAEAERAAGLFQRRIDQLQLTDTEIIGPAPCFFAKINYTYRWHILLRGPEPTLALDGVDIPKGWYVDIDPVDVL